MWVFTGGKQHTKQSFAWLAEKLAEKYCMGKQTYQTYWCARGPRGLMTLVYILVGPPISSVVHTKVYWYSTTMLAFSQSRGTLPLLRECVYLAVTFG